MSGQGRAVPQGARCCLEACERRLIWGEPSDRFNVVQEEMADSRQNYAMLKELLKDDDFRELSGKVLEVKNRLEERRST